MPDRYRRGAPRINSCHVFAATDFEVIEGVCRGDSLMPASQLCAGDIYRMVEGADPRLLTVQGRSGASPTPRHWFQTVAAESDVALPGDRVSVTGRLMLIGAGGDRVELLLISISPQRGGATDMLHVLPLDPVDPCASYSLIRVESDPGPVRLNDIASVAFTHGTRITLADGSQRVVEQLAPGDWVLTRDNGPQPLRWIGRRWVRAVGPYAPVVIGRDLLGNPADLIISQQQRLFVYQRGSRRLADRAEVLVKAKHLVDGDDVTIRNGGLEEFFHLVFDRHEIIYAECVPTESLFLDEHALSQLPDDMASELTDTLPALRHRPHVGAEADRHALRNFGLPQLRRPAWGG